MSGEEIRADWESALNSVERGWDLSADIEWGFGKQDLLVLGVLYQYGANTDIQQKIVDLLEDCNFHTECGLLYDNKIDEYFEVVIAEYTEE